MYPLLVGAIASTASTLLDKWHASSGQNAAAQTAAFQQMMDKIAGASQTAAANAQANSPQAALANLRSQLFDSPEIRSILDSADPSKPVSIDVSPDGKVTAQTPGRYPQPVVLSPETAALARQYGAATAPAPGAITSSAALNFAALKR